MKFRFAVLMGGVALVATAHAAELPAANPVEFAAALAHAKTGDTVVLADGTWRDANLTLNVAGTSIRMTNQV